MATWLKIKDWLMLRNSNEATVITYLPLTWSQEASISPPSKPFSILVSQLSLNDICTESVAPQELAHTGKP